MLATASLADYVGHFRFGREFDCRIPGQIAGHGNEGSLVTPTAFAVHLPKLISNTGHRLIRINKAVTGTA